MATSRRHPLFLFFGPPTRPTTQTPHNTQQSRGGQDRGTPGQMNAGARTARHQARAHFAWVLRSSRQVGAGSRGRVTTDGSPAPHQNSAMSQNSGAPVQRRATQPRPCARADTTRPATANYPPVCRECNTTFIPSRCAYHITTSLHITSHAPTEPTGVVSQGTGKCHFCALASPPSATEVSEWSSRPACDIGDGSVRVVH